MKNPKIVITLILIVIIIGGLFLASYLIGGKDSGEVKGILGGESGEQIITDYIKTNISLLATVAPSPGGTFYVTGVDINNGNGVVYFEDGHISYAANFKYTFDQEGNPVISSFVVRNNVDANTSPSEADIFK